MMAIIIVSTLLATILLGPAASAPNNSPLKSWTFCKEVKPDENNLCLVKAVSSALSNDLFKGNSYFGTPSLDPLDISRLSVFDADGSKSVALNITFKNGKIFGMSNFDLQEVKTDWSKGKMSATVKLNEPVKFNSDYKIGGKVLLLPISGEGKSQLTFLDMTVVMSGDLKVIEKKNKKYFNIEKFSVDMRPKNFKIHLENLFNGNKALGDNMNTVLNENWRELQKDVGVPLSQGLGEAFRQIASRIFAKIPLDTLTPK